MNSFNYKTGKLIVNDKEYELTKMQSKVLSCLIPNKLITYSDIYNYMYDVNIGYVECRYTRAISSHICRLRKTGLEIESKYGYGVRLVSKVCLQ